MAWITARRWPLWGNSELKVVFQNGAVMWMKSYELDQEAPCLVAFMNYWGYQQGPLTRRQQGCDCLCSVQRNHGWVRHDLKEDDTPDYVCTYVSYCQYKAVSNIAPRDDVPTWCPTKCGETPSNLRVREARSWQSSCSCSRECVCTDTGQHTRPVWDIAWSIQHNEVDALQKAIMSESYSVADATEIEAACTSQRGLILHVLRGTKALLRQFVGTVLTDSLATLVAEYILHLLE